MVRLWNYHYVSTFYDENDNHTSARIHINYIFTKYMSNTINIIW